jgi:hypothetical protein
MEEWQGWICFILILVLAGWGLDRHLRLRDVEIELKDYLGDLLVARDAALDKICQCCSQTRVLQFKALIRRHFKL